MANGLYSLARQKFLGATLDGDSHTFRSVFGDAADYTVALTTHEFFVNATMPTAGRIPAGTDASQTNHQAFASVSIANGVFSATALQTFSSVTGDVAEQIIMYRSTATDATSELVAFWDTGVTGLPVTPNGGNITITWPSVAGTSGVFTL